MNNKLEKRLQAIEEKLAQLLTQETNKCKVISQTEFMNFYNNIKYTIPQQHGVIPTAIWFDEKFAEQFKHKLLYPDYDNGYWFVIGDNEAIPVGFKKLDTDYYVDFRAVGKFI